MEPCRLSRYRRAQLRLEHRLVLPLHRFFNRIPGLEYGLNSATVTRIECRHTPLAGRRAVQISDLHLDYYLPRHDAVLNRIAGLKPDWIFVTGDLLNVPEGVPHLFRFLAGLRSLCPVYLTLGNHDHFSGVPVDRFAELADRHKLSLLINQTVFLPFNNGELGIIGLDDPSLHRANLGCIPPPVPGRFTVLLAHAPVVLDLLDRTHAVDLVLCGHSHGGQCRIPFIPTFWLPYGSQGRTAGEFFKNGHRLHVTRGLGWSLLPVRFRCAPEIVLIEWTEGASQ